MILRLPRLSTTSLENLSSPKDHHQPLSKHQPNNHLRLEVLQLPHTSSNQSRRQSWVSPPSGGVNAEPASPVFAARLTMCDSAEETNPENVPWGLSGRPM